jgi:hypothetical protein
MARLKAVKADDKSSGRRQYPGKVRTLARLRARPVRTRVPRQARRAVLRMQVMHFRFQRAEIYWTGFSR